MSAESAPAVDWHGKAPDTLVYRCETCRVGMSADNIPVELEQTWEKAHDGHEVTVTVNG